MVVIGERIDADVTPSPVKVCSLRAQYLYMYVCMYCLLLPLQHMGLRLMTGRAHSISPHIQCIYTICNRKAESLKLFMLSYVHVYFSMCSCVYMFRHMSRTYISTCSSFNPVPIMACKILVEVQANNKLCAKTAVPALINYSME